ncbi:MAG TPA: chromophore lyase CpcT/CpeT [Chroococcales cyanobacterium]
MNKLKACTLTVLLSTLTVVQQSRAATIAPPLESQVEQVADWFTGSFDNAQQIASNPSVPLITMNNCEVQLAGANPTNETQNVYLEQSSTAFNRVRFYSFSEGTSAVTLSIYSFVNNNVLSGLCNRPESERVVNISNILTATSCNVELFWEPTRYIGNNAPTGCPTSSGGKVVSNVEVFGDRIDSLDRIFSANGTLIAGTPIEFRRITSVPEPSSLLGLVAFGIWSTGKARSRKQKKTSTQNENIPLYISSKRNS